MRKKTTVYIGEELLRAAKLSALRRGKKEEVFQEALRGHLGLGVIDKVRSRSELGEDEAMTLADREKHASRP